MSDSLRKVGIVVGREYLQRVRKKSFIISTIAFPVILLASFALPAFFAARGEGRSNQMVLVDHTGVLASDLIERLGEAGVTAEEASPDSPELEEALSQARDGEISGILEVDSATFETGVARWTGEDPPSQLRSVRLRQAVTQTVFAHRLEEALGDAQGISSFQPLLDGGELEFVSLDPESPDELERVVGFGAGFVGAFLLYITLITYGTMVMRAVLEEKTGRIAEVVLSAIHPRALMLGKILGVGAVGFTQMAVWVGSAILLVSAGLPALLSFLPPEVVLDTDIIEVIRAGLPAAGVALFFLACYVLGFLTYASLFAAVGAMCSSEEDAGQLLAPLIMLVVLPMALIMPVMRSPDATFAVLLSLFPFFSPILMFARVASGVAPLWQAALSILLMGGTLLLISTAAGKIYRTGILMQGKRPNLPEIWRWVREG